MPVGALTSGTVILSLGSAIRGENGIAGIAGLSAYSVALTEGFVGTEAEWLLTLKGDTGLIGPAGADGASTDIAADTHAATAKPDPDDADESPWADSSAGWVLKKLTWANVKSRLTSYFNGVYQAILVSGTNIKTINSTSLLGSGDIAVGASIAPLVITDSNTVEQYNGTTAQQHHIYNTRTDPSNYERGVLRCSGGEFNIGTERSGSGGAMTLRIFSGYHSTAALKNEAGFVGSYGPSGSTDVRGGISLGNPGPVIIAGNGGVVFAAGTNGLGYVSRGVNACSFGPSAGTHTQLTHVLKPTAKNQFGNYLGDGHHLDIRGGAGSSAGGDTDGGWLTLSGGAGHGAGRTGYIIIQNLPTSAAGLPTGALYNAAGVLMVA